MQRDRILPTNVVRRLKPPKSSYNFALVKCFHHRSLSSCYHQSTQGSKLPPSASWLSPCPGVTAESAWKNVECSQTHTLQSTQCSKILFLNNTVPSLALQVHSSDLGLVYATVFSKEITAPQTTKSSFH